ncbi:MAG: hypothetical protein LCH44_04980 [Bacteroidetes bacterium]|jgi:hypothetical protein|nr:hypothetical protein [Bacteroidota bacterium]MCB0605086.1 hypothetical protein [Saprospiraceae bacterium]MCO5277627.1 hypothetical protein [Saprospiraceae bacterium]
MKKLVFIAFSVILLGSGIFLMSFASNNNDILWPKIKVVFGTKSHPAKDGEGCEGDKGICIRIAVESLSTNPNTVSDTDLGVAELQVDNNVIIFNVVKDNSGTISNTFTLEQDITLTDSVARQLGLTKCILKAGVYPYSTKEHIVRIPFKN